MQAVLSYGAFPLFRCDPVKECRDDGEYYVREPEGNCWRQCVCMYEHLAESEEEDVCEGQCDTYTDVPSDSSSLLLG